MINANFLMAVAYVSLLEDMTKKLRASGGGVNTFTYYMHYMDTHKQFFPIIQSELLDSGKAQLVPVAEFKEPTDGSENIGLFLMEIKPGSIKGDFRVVLLNPESVAFLDAQNDEAQNLSKEEMDKLFPI